MIDRRTFVGVAAAGLVTTWSVAEAQPAARVRRIGYLGLGTAESAAPLLQSFTDGLRDLGLVEDREFVFERRYAQGDLGRLPEFAAELVRLQVDAIVTATNVVTAAAQRATATIPIVMIAAFDPVRAGFIASLARPGGNITGLSLEASPELLGKQLAFLNEVLPKLTHVAVLFQGDPGRKFTDLEAGARRLNVALHFVNIRSPDEMEGAFAAIVGRQSGGLIVTGGALIYMQRQRISDFALRHGLPAIYLVREAAQAGLLMSYGPNLPYLYRQAATYISRILAGAKPGDLPVEQPTRFELVINLKTAKALGVKIPQSLLVRADEVIQ